MSKPETWQDKKAWLQSHFARVTTVWNGPDEYHSDFTGLSVLVLREKKTEELREGEGSIYRARPHVTIPHQNSFAPTGEESIEKLFQAIACHDANSWLRVNNAAFDEPKHYKVDPDTFELKEIAPQEPSLP